MDYKDKMTNESSLTTIAELQTKYETEKKEQQIALQKAEIMEQKAKNSLSIATIIGLLILLGLLVIITMLARSWGRKKHAMQIQRAEIRQREIQIEAALNSQESERKRFARDLHDGFGQMISVLNLNLNSLKSDQSDREQLFQNSRKVLDDMYKELKGICFNLMPETLIKSGVVDAIKEFALRVNNTGKVVMMFDTFGLEQRLMDLQEISIYRITQEWVNNILKYSDADKITISLTRDEEEITLLIEDNGPGFDKQNLIQGTGNGWKNMNSRSNLIKGELELDTTPGLNGTTLILNLPYKIYQETKNPSIEIPS
jgi:signal transduction histidine kinase